MFGVIVSQRGSLCLVKTIIFLEIIFLATERQSTELLSDFTTEDTSFTKARLRIKFSFAINSFYFCFQDENKKETFLWKQNEGSYLE